MPDGGCVFGKLGKEIPGGGKAFRGEGTLNHRSGRSLAKDKIKGINSSLLVEEFGFYLAGI